MNKVGEFKGDRDGTVYHAYDGFFYRTNNVRENQRYLICHTKKCPGRALMPNNPEYRTLNNFKMTSLHNHPPNFNRIGLLNLRRKLKARSESELTPIKQIFEEEIAKVPEEVAKLINYSTYRSTMKKCRNQMQKAVMSSLLQNRKPVEISEVEYAENPVAIEETAESADHEDHNVAAVESKRKRASPKTSSQPLIESNVKKAKPIEPEEVVETTYFQEVEQADDVTYEDENNDEDAYNNQVEENEEDLSSYLKFYKTKPAYKKDQSEDLLSTFFSEMEKTVRSFLPSVIIEAKGRIASLIHKLELKNWQVQQLLEEKEQEKLKPLSVQEQEQRKLFQRLKEQQRQLIQQQEQQQEILKMQQETQKLHQYVRIIKINKQNLAGTQYQVVDEEHQVTDEQGSQNHDQSELIHEQGSLVYEEVQLTQEENQLVHEQHEESQVVIGLT